MTHFIASLALIVAAVGTARASDMSEVAIRKLMRDAQQQIRRRMEDQSPRAPVRIDPIAQNAYWTDKDRTGMPAPPIRLRDARGELFDSEAKRGKFLLVAFLGRDEDGRDPLQLGVSRSVVNHFVDLRLAYRGVYELELLQVGLGMTPAEASRRYGGQRIGSVVADSDLRVAGDYRLTGTPTLMLIDPQGRIGWSQSGLLPGWEAKVWGILRAGLR
jgi:hypothetical protein